MDEHLSDEDVTDYLEGEVPEDKRQAIEEHLVGCDECHEKMVLYMKVLKEETTDEENQRLEQLGRMWDKGPGQTRQAPSSQGGYWGKTTFAAAVMLLIAWTMIKSVTSFLLVVLGAAVLITIVIVLAARKPRR